MASAAAASPADREGKTSSLRAAAVSSRLASSGSGFVLGARPFASAAFDSYQPSLGLQRAVRVCAALARAPRCVSVLRGTDHFLDTFDVLRSALLRAVEAAPAEALPLLFVYAGHREVLAEREGPGGLRASLLLEFGDVWRGSAPALVWIASLQNEPLARLVRLEEVRFLDAPAQDVVVAPAFATLRDAFRAQVGASGWSRAAAPRPTWKRASRPSARGTRSSAAAPSWPRPRCASASCAPLTAATGRAWSRTFWLGGWAGARARRPGPTTRRCSSPRSNRCSCRRRRRRAWRWRRR